MSDSTFFYRMGKAIAPYFGIDENDACSYIKDAPGLPIMMALIASQLYQNTGGKLPKSCWHIPNFDWPVGLTYNEAYAVDHLLNSIFPMFVSAVKGDQSAKYKVKAITRIINNKDFSLYEHDIEDIANKSYNQSRARAWDIYRLMSRVSYAVTPKTQKAKSVLVGKVKLIELKFVKVHDREVLRVRELWNPRATLQSLAIRLYHEELERWENSCEIDSLERDMRDAKAWVKKNPDKLTKHPISIHTFDNQGNQVNTEQISIGGGSFLYGKNDW